MTNKKIIFLDIDGVLNKFNCPDSTYMTDNFVEPYLVKKLEKIIEADYINTFIVISSSWAKEAKPMLIEHSFKYPEKIIDVTSRVKRWRGEQIRDWLQKHPDIFSYVVLEDEPFDVCGEKCNVIPKNRVIQTDFKTGITDDNVDKAINILSKRIKK